MKKAINNLYNFILITFTSSYITEIDATYHIGVSEKFLQRLSKANVIKTIGDENKFYNRKQLDTWVKKNRIVNAN